MSGSARGRARAVVSGAGTPEYSFGIVLVLILVTLGFQVAAPEEEWARFLILTMHGIVLISALLAARAGRAIVAAAVVAVVTALLVSGLALVGPGELREVPAAAVNMLFIGVTPVIVARGLIREIREEGTVTIRTMFGVLCIYLLAGVFFAFIYAVIDAETANEFFPDVDPASTSDFLYFSFTTLTTTGYGDLVTVNELGRSMAVLEALIGQIYLVTVVALIVANMRPRRRAT
jgi:Ion channel